MRSRMRGVIPCCALMFMYWKGRNERKGRKFISRPPLPIRLRRDRMANELSIADVVKYSHIFSVVFAYSRLMRRKFSAGLCRNTEMDSQSLEYKLLMAHGIKLNQSGSKLEWIRKANATSGGGCTKVTIVTIISLVRTEWGSMGDSRTRRAALQMGAVKPKCNIQRLPVGYDIYAVSRVAGAPSPRFPASS